MTLMPSKRALRAFRENKVSLVGLGLVAILLFMAIFADFIVPYDVRVQDVIGRYESPGAAHLLGTDEFGRDVFSRIILGSRVSLFVGITSVTAGMLFGSWLGILAGYKGGRTDSVISWVVDTLMAFPSLLLGLMVVSALARACRTPSSPSPWPSYPGSPGWPGGRPSCSRRTSSS